MVCLGIFNFALFQRREGLSASSAVLAGLQVFFVKECLERHMGVANLTEDVSDEVFDATLLREVFVKELRD